MPENTQHKLTFKAVYTIKEVPDSFTGIVFEDEDGVLNVQHFNNPKGNMRKVITLKNKLPAGVFDGIRRLLYSLSQGGNITYPQETERLKNF